MKNRWPYKMGLITQNQQNKINHLAEKGGEIVNVYSIMDFPDGSQATVDMYGRVEWVAKPRTKKQNSSLHLWFTLLMNALNDAGLDQRKFLKPGIEISWTEYAIKKHIWKPVQEAMTGKESTTELDTGEVSKIYKEIDRHLGMKHGIHVPFPKKKSKDQ